MGVFQYIATDVDLTVARGTVVADSPRQARDELRQRGLNVHELAPHAERLSLSLLGRLISGARFTGRGGFRRQAQLVAFVRELSTLLGVGMPLLEALDTLARQAGRRSALRPTILALRERVAAGQSLAEAMREQGTAFDAVTVSMTEVGEDAGTLETVLEELAEFKERSAQLRGKIGTALIYPAIVLAMGIGVSLFLMTYVVPALLEGLAEAGQELPRLTLWVKAASDLLINWWWALVVALVVIGGSFTVAVKSARGRWHFDRLVLQLPGVGDLVRKQAVVRAAFVIATLMRSGIAFERAVAIAQRSMRNVVLRDALARCERAVRAGRDIGVALEDTRAFPLAVVQVFALGQHSGRMEEMLERLAKDYDRQVAAAAAQLTAVLEPVLIVLLASLVGAIAFATILPILEAGHVL